VSCAEVNPRPQPKRPFISNSTNAQRADVYAAKAEAHAPPKEDMTEFVNTDDE
jgi:hypothetical protein